MRFTQVPTHHLTVYVPGSAKILPKAMESFHEKPIPMASLCTLGTSSLAINHLALWQLSGGSLILIGYFSSLIQRYVFSTFLVSLKLVSYKLISSALSFLVV